MRRARLLVTFLVAANLASFGCKEEKKEEKAASAAKDEKKEKDEKKKGDDDEDEKKDDKKKKGDDDEDEKKDDKKKKKDDEDDEAATDEKKKKKTDDDDDDKDEKKKKKGSKTLTLKCTDSVKSVAAQTTEDEFSGTCPKACTIGSVWGTGTYTTDSAICVAAVHAGVLDPKEGGDVDVTVIAGLASYKGSTANGVTTGSWGKYEKSYTVKGPLGDSADGKKTTAAVESGDTPFAGKYSSNWGNATFTQKGNSVSGVYPKGTLACTVVNEGKSLACRWNEGGSVGGAYLTRQANGSLAGSWGSGTSSSNGGPWLFTPIK
jgi:hypothetical protein